jgi:serine protease Do
MNVMKNFPILTGVAALVLAPALPVRAIEGEPDDARPPQVAPPAEAAPDAQPNNAAPAEKAAVPYLGVVSNPVTPTLAEHLALKAGEGIVVGAVMPGGPAEKAGVAVHDVITRLGDEPVGSSEELTHRVSAHKPGDAVKLELIHKGKPAQLEVVLGTRPEQLAMPQPQALDQLNLEGVPQDLADRVRRMIEGNLGELKLDFGQDVQEAAPQVEDALRQMRERMEKAMRGAQIPEIPQGGFQIPQGGIRIHQGAALRMMDDQGSIEVKSNDDGKEITVRDKDNHITWTGPWDTEQDKAAAPEDIRQRIERLNIDDAGNGLRLNFRQVIPRR